MEIRGIQLKISLFNPGKLIREAVASVQPQALSKDLSLNVFVPDDMPPVWADRGKVAQVLGILLSNAVKFCDEAGTIQIHARHQPDHTVFVAVSDTGIGIDTAHHQRVFDKFYQVDSSKSRRFEGAGIGLYIAKSIVEAHGGHIELESQLRKGSTFTIVLPHAAFDTSFSMPKSELLANLNLLVVAEGPTFRRSVSEVLRSCGATIEEAANGYECVRIAEEIEPDAIVFDEVLSDVAGGAAISNLRQNPTTFSIPVLAVTGEKNHKLAETVRSVNDVSILEKPFGGQELVVRLRQMALGDWDVPLQTPEEGYAARVLVVDSDPDLREWMETALRFRGIMCQSGETIAEALEKGEQFRLDAAFIDVESLHGDKDLAQLHESKSLRHAVLYVMSGDAADTGMPEGAAGVLRKPFAIDEVARIVQALVAQVRAEAVAAREDSAGPMV